MTDLDLDAIERRYFGDDEWRYRTGKTPLRDIGDLLAEVRLLRTEVATCICQSWPPEGPSAECPVHGAIRAFNEASRALAAAEAARDEAQAEAERSRRQAAYEEREHTQTLAQLAERDTELAKYAETGEWRELYVLIGADGEVKYETGGYDSLAEVIADHVIYPGERMIARRVWVTPIDETEDK